MRKLGTAGVIVISLVASTVGVLAGVAHADPTPVTFRPHVEFATPAPPWAVATGDLNGDALLDVVTANNGASVSVLLGDGTGGLGPKTDFATGSFPISVATGDLNGDTLLDVVTANYGDASVSVLLGDGAGGLGPKTDFPAGDSPRSVVLGDLNGDTSLDLALANNDISVSVLLGDGAGSFGPATARVVGFARSVAMGDLNDDTFLDLAVATNLDPAVSVLLGDGLGGFGPETKTEGASCCEPFEVVIGDLNGDTFLDLVTANGTGDRVSVRLGDGIGGFGPPADYATGYSPGPRPALGDLNGDTFLDVLAASSDGNGVSVLLGDGSGVLVSRTDIPTLSASGVVVGDLNGDARPDVVVANSYDNSVSVVLNTTGVPATVPDAPTIGTAIATNLQVTVSWTAPWFDGGAAVDGYVVTPYVGVVAQPAVVFGSTATTQTLTGLANGTTYTFRVAATNSVGTGPDSDASNEVTPSTTVAGAPTILRNATAGNASATLSWVAPASDGGSPVTGYVVTPYIGYFPLPPVTFGSTATTQTITGLTNGTEYRFRVQAINTVGTSDYSKVTNPVTPKAVLVVTPDLGLVDGQIVTIEGVGWVPGHSIGFCQAVEAGAPGPGNCADGLYTQVTADSSGAFSGSLTLQRTIFVPNLGLLVDCAGPAQSCVVGAADGQDLVGTVVVASLGFVTVPGAPTIIRNATAGDRQATVSWTAPLSDGGGAISGYVITPYIGYFPLPPVSFGSTATTQTITGLTNGTEYRFRVQAINTVGTSDYSKVTNPVTPTA